MPAPEFRRLVEVVAALRGEGGCPWDRVQTHRTLRRFVLEEAYEVLEALDSGDPDRLREELGDLLFQVVMHARLAEEAGEFDLADVCRGIADKMVRRHPHVFADLDLRTPEQVVERWEAMKMKEEGSRRESLLDGIPRELPALLRAQRVAGRAAEAGFAWPDARAALEKVREELGEVEEVLDDPERLEQEMGDLLFAVASLAAKTGVDAESSLRRALGTFGARFQRLEQRLGPHLREADGEELLRAWREDKR